jgi:hypothetical protein
LLDVRSSMPSLAYAHAWPATGAQSIHDRLPAVTSSIERAFVVENLEPAASFIVFASAVKLAGKEGPRSEAVVADVLARAAA